MAKKKTGQAPARPSRLNLKERPGGAYFLDQSEDVQFVHSGATGLDCILGGGYPLGRVVNIIGDKSTGKTLMAIEGAINFAYQYPNGRIRVLEPESALGRGYARELGMPLERVEFVDDEVEDADKDELETVEGWYEDLNWFLDDLKPGQPGLYILDSLDALTTKAEKEREFGKASMGDGKAKDMSKLFRLLRGKLKRKNCLLIVISQVRDNIGVTFGSSKTRSGGRALDFYASQIFWLAQLATIQRTISGVTRAIGISVRARVTKNKVGIQFREFDLDIRYTYGIDDVSSSVKWLAKVGRQNLVQAGLAPSPEKITAFLKGLESLSPDVYDQWKKKIAAATKKVWQEVEQAFLPERKKYR